MLKIRLQRVGRRNHAEFRMVVCEHTLGPKSAGYTEVLGHYNPHTNAVTVKEDRLKHWVGVGAQVSDTVHNLLVKEGLIEGKKKNVLPKKSAPTPEPVEEAVAEPTPADESATEAEETAEATPEEASADTPAEEEKKEEAVTN